MSYIYCYIGEIFCWLWCSRFGWLLSKIGLSYYLLFKPYQYFMLKSSDIQDKTGNGPWGSHHEQ